MYKRTETLIGVTSLNETILPSLFACSLIKINVDGRHRKTVTSVRKQYLTYCFSRFKPDKNCILRGTTNVLRDYKLLSPFALSIQNIGKRHRIKLLRRFNPCLVPSRDKTLIGEQTLYSPFALPSNYSDERHRKELLRLLSERSPFDSVCPKGYSLMEKHLQFLYSPFASSVKNIDKWHSKELLHNGTVGCWFESFYLDYITRYSSMVERLIKSSLYDFNLIFKNNDKWHSSELLQNLNRKHSLRNLPCLLNTLLLSVSTSVLTYVKSKASSLALFFGLDIMLDKQYGLLYIHNMNDKIRNTHLKEINLNGTN